jgi:hypothetical protein
MILNLNKNNGKMKKRNNDFCHSGQGISIEGSAIVFPPESKWVEEVVFIIKFFVYLFVCYLNSFIDVYENSLQSCFEICFGFC